MEVINYLLSGMILEVSPSCQELLWFWLRVKILEVADVHLESREKGLMSMMSYFFRKNNNHIFSGPRVPHSTPLLFEEDHDSPQSTFTYFYDLWGGTSYAEVNVCLCFLDTPSFLIMI